MDFSAMASHFGGEGTKLWFMGDFNYDTVVNSCDFTVLSANFNKLVPPPLPGVPLGAVVPEPWSAWLLAGALIVRTRRRAR